MLPASLAAVCRIVGLAGMLEVLVSAGLTAGLFGVIITPQLPCLWRQRKVERAAQKHTLQDAGSA